MKNFQEVVPGIFRGGLPTSEEIQILKNIWNIQRIISLDFDGGEKIEPICKSLDVEHLILPIDHDEDYFSEKRMRRAINFLSDNIVELLTDKQPVYIHCIHGQDRTGLAIALYRIKAEKWSDNKALLEAKSFGFGDGLSPQHLNLFVSIIRKASKKDSNDDADVVSKVRESFDNGSSTGPETGFNYFAPIPPLQEFVAGYPKTIFPPESFAVDDVRRRKRTMRKIYLQDVNDAMAFVGMRNEVSPILKDVSPVGRNTSSEGIGPMGILPYGNYYL